MLTIALIIVFCIDLSGAMPKLNRLVWRWLYPKVTYTDWQIPLLSCSLCCTWWVGILYLLITGFSWCGLLKVAIIAFLTPIFKDIFILIKDILTWLLNKISDLFL